MSEVTFETMAIEIIKIKQLLEKLVTVEPLYHNKNSGEKECHYCIVDYWRLAGESNNYVVGLEDHAEKCPYREAREWLNVQE